MSYFNNFFKKNIQPLNNNYSVNTNTNIQEKEQFNVIDNDNSNIETNNNLLPNDVEINTNGEPIELNNSDKESNNEDIYINSETDNTAEFNTISVSDNNFSDNSYESDESGDISDEEIFQKPQRKSTYTIVATVAYLLGIHKTVYEKEEHPYSLELFEKLEQNEDAKVIRALCSLRSDIAKNIKSINFQMRHELLNLNSMDKYINVSALESLKNNRIFVQQANYTAEKYIVDINKYINDRINKCKDLFPYWINWSYIRELFIMPKGTTTDGAYSQSVKFSANRGNYPYSTYISWDPIKYGHILYSDRRFLTSIYAHNGDVFKEYDKVTETNEEAQVNIFNFLDNNENTVIVVDCENSDPYKLYACLSSLKKDELQKVKKIILYDDVHTTSTWNILKQFVDISIEYVLIERIKENKSLVDLKMTAGTCKEHYANNINSFILCSSDSDYWALISSLPNVNFLVMYEDSKCSQDTLDALQEANIPFCSLDDFSAGNSSNIIIKALTGEIYNYIRSNMTLNANEMLNYAITQTRLNMTENEKKQFYDNYIKNMRLVIDSSTGDVSIVLK